MLIRFAENMHHFIGDTRQLKINATGAFKRQAETTYNENLSAYVRLILRRPFAKIIVSKPSNYQGRCN